MHDPLLTENEPVLGELPLVMRVGQQLSLLVDGKVGVDLLRPAVVEGLYFHGCQPLLKALGEGRVVSGVPRRVTGCL